jgi:hypothetical protein
MSKILFASLFALLALIIVAVSSISASSFKSVVQQNQHQHHSEQQQQRMLRAPKNNAKYNLTTQDKKIGASAVLGVDLYLPYPSSTWLCLMLAGFQFSIVRAWHSYGGPDFSAEINLNNAAQAGIAFRDIYFFPCASGSGADAAAQLREAVRVSPTETWGTLWLDIEQNPSPNCGWSATNFTKNCNFLQALIAEGQALSLQMGLYSSHYEWTQLFGSPSFCTVAADAGLPLWYAAYDGQTNFNNFAPFGGYTLNGQNAKVSMKQFTDNVSDCNVIADQDFYPA